MMASNEHGHSFVIRFWLERRERRNATPLWRAMIRHVPSGRQIHSENLEDITSFIGAYLHDAPQTQRISTESDFSKEATVDHIDNPNTEKNPNRARRRG